VAVIRFQALPVTLDAAAADGKPRTITGMAVPWDTTATLSSGETVRFVRGAFDVNAKPAKLIQGHDMSRLLGTVTELADSAEGLLFTATFANTRDATDAVELIKAGAIDAVSVGAVPVRATVDADGVQVIHEARLMELSLVPYPAFEDATISSLAAAQEMPAPTDNVGHTDNHKETGDTTTMDQPVTAAAQADDIIPTNSLPAQPRKEMRMPSAAEYLAAYHIGGDTFAKVNAAYQEVARANRTTLQAAAGDVLTTDTPGLLPVPVLGPLVQDIAFLRPAINAIGARAYPDSGAQKTFVRPTITTHTSVAAQAAELNAVSATTMVIASNSVSRTTLAGQVTLSVQDIDFTSPAAMGLILNDLMGEYMIASDNLCADNLLAAATSSGVWDGTLADLLASVYDAANDVSSGRNWMPTHMFVSVDVWAQLGKLADTTGRPVFPFVANGLSGQNALGTQNAASWNGNPLGLELVVDSNFAAKTMVITRVGQGAGDAFEFYEQQRGLMSVEAPSVLGRTFSFHGYVSTFAAIPGMIRKITQA
jgi:HK97 family phage prohead protease